MIKTYPRPIPVFGILPVPALAILLFLSPVSAEDEFCLDCHTEPAGFQHSVHAEQTCLGCHDTAGEASHPGLLPKVLCSNCHPDVQEEFSESLHATSVLPESRREPARPPDCADCHGTHDILGALDSESRTFRLRIPQLCGQCHGDQKFVREYPDLLSTRPFFAYQESVHGRAIARGETEAAVCTDCHGIHALFLPRDPRARISRQNIPETCGQCHQEEASAYRRSIHGESAARGNSQVPVCTDCHGIHSILPHIDPESSVAEQAIARTTCAQCHAGERLSQEFGVPGGRVSSYLDSYHGLAQQLGSVVVANCASCHGVHEILPSSDPRSSVHPDNLPATCGQCHPGAGENFARGKIHLLGGGDTESPGAFAVNLVRAIYVPLILLTIGGMLLHNALDFLRRVIRPPTLEPRGRYVKRMSLEQRLEHGILIVAFFCLVVTGFALKYPDAWWVNLSHLQEVSRRAIHRSAGATLTFLALYHLVSSLATRYGRAELRALRPRIRDLRDAARQVAFNLGLRKTPPRCGRYRYEEKLEYWALVWGIGLMAITGGILWFENFSLRFLPKWALDVTVAVHLYEAWLATLAILVWHHYFVIFRPGVYPMNWTWITGRISESVLREEHPEEWEAKFGNSPQTGSRRGNGDSF